MTRTGNDKFTIRLKIVKILRTFVFNSENRLVTRVADETDTGIGFFN